MQYYLKIIWYLLIAGVSNAGMAQEYEVRHWSLEEGLSNSVVHDILQDRYGFLWIATSHGLNCFDGHQFRTYRYHPLDSLSIGGNHIKNVIQTSDGNIWAILSIGGLARWHRHNETFSYYNHFGSPADSTASIYVTDVIKLAEATYLIGARNGLFLLDPERTQPRQLLAEGPDSNLLFVTKLQLDQQGRVWVSSRRGTYQYDYRQNKLRPIYFYHPGRDTMLFAGAPFTHLLQDDQERIWVGTAHSGVFLYDEKIQGLRGHWRQLDPSLSDWQTTTGIVQGQDGRIWYSTQQQGLFYYQNASTGFQKQELAPDISIKLMVGDSTGNLWMVGNETQVFRFNNQQLSEYELSGKDKEWVTINDLFVDRKNGLWVGSNGKGMWQIAKKRWNFQTVNFLQDEKANPSPSGHVTAVLEDSDRNIWIGTKMGLIKCNSNLQPLAFFNPRQGGLRSLAGFYVMDLLEDHRGQIWVGTTFGISILDKNKGWVKDYRNNPEDEHSLRNNIAADLTQDQQDRIWIGTQQGLHRYVPESDDFVAFQPQPENPQSLSGHDIREVIASHEPNVFWIGLTGGGLNRMQYFPEKDSIVCSSYFFKSAHQHSQQVATINALHEDRNGQLWVGAYSMGFLKFDKPQDRLVNAQNQIATIPNIASIVEDRNGDLWIAANNGLWRYTPEDQTFRQFTHKNGLSSNQFSYNAACMAQNGNLFFGNINGLDFFDPQELGTAIDVTPPLIYSFRKYDETIHFDQPLYELSSLELTYRDNYIHFDFLSPEFQHPEQVRYAYQLEGFDPEWHYCKSPGQANYTNLPGGNYTFKVKAGNEEGEWNPKVSTLKLIVKPPFWKQLWFKIGTVLIGLLLLFSFFRIRWAIKMQQIHEVAKVREKAAADFHDELGHRLTKISLFSETLMRVYPQKSRELKPFLEKIKNNSDELYHSLRDFVWVMNPRKDSLLELAILLKDFGDELFDNTGVDFRVKGIVPALKKHVLNMDWKRHLVLIFKEAMHNALKHSHCQNVNLAFRLENGTLHISLTDDGSGFVKNEKRQGYGIGNMQNRAEKIGGILSINGLEGTCVQFQGEL